MTFPGQPVDGASQNIEIVLHYVEQIERRRLIGAIVECGVYQGSSLCAIAALLNKLDSSRPIVGFDSFQGLPEPVSFDRIEDPSLLAKAKRGYFGDTSLETVRDRVGKVGYSGDVTLVPGWFQDTLPVFDNPIALLFLDCDFYESYVVSLRYLWPFVVPGGYVVFDEYDSRKYPGARRAVDEFFSELPEKPTCDRRFTGATGFTRWFVEKRPVGIGPL